MSDRLPPSLVRLLDVRGFRTEAEQQAFIQPSLDGIAGPSQVPDMARAVDRLRMAIQKEAPIAIYADRDVDGLTGLAILVRSLRTLGAVVVWGSPLHGRGVERPVLETLMTHRPGILIFVDCGTGEEQEVDWLAAQGVDVIVADHHRLSNKRGNVFAWIHPEAIPSPPSSLPAGRGEKRGEGEAPCGSVMAFKLAQALWVSFIGTEDHGRLDYFLNDHLDLLALGILADRVPVTGQNRIFVWHGLRRLARTRKTGLASLLRFLRVGAESSVTVRQATWQIIPLLNAAGRLRQPHWTADLLLTEDPWMARGCIDALLGLNTTRRRAQDESAELFEKTVLEQCHIEDDAVLIATARDLEPSVTGLAAQSIVKKYGRPAFLFVEQGDDLVGSGRGTGDHDLFSWIEPQRDILVKFGGHEGAVGLSVRKSDFPALREGLLRQAEACRASAPKSAAQPEIQIPLREMDGVWWDAYRQLEPFGQGFDHPRIELMAVDQIRFPSKRSTKRVMLRSGAFEWPAELPSGVTLNGDGPWRVVATVQAAAKSDKSDFPFQWCVEEVSSHG